MKRALWFLILILVILTAYSAKKSPATVMPTQAQPTATAANVEKPAQSKPMPVTGKPSSTAAPEQVLKVLPTAAPVKISAEAVVGEGGLNLRYGPGLNYKVSRVLQPGQVVRLEGRSRDGAWVVARLSDGSAGWVFGSYLQTSADLMSLPMLEAAGGPGDGLVSVGNQTQISATPLSAVTGAPTPAAAALPRRYSLNMSIQENQAEVSLARFPANSEVIIRLGVRGEGPSMTVATTKTDENGSASIRFEMPSSWPDGNPLTQNELRLTASTADGSFSGGANISYSAAQ